MTSRSLACLAVLVACGPAAPLPSTGPKPPVVTAPAGAPAAPPLDGEVARWIAKLDDANKLDLAGLKLEELGDPRAIPAIGKAWREHRTVQLLRVIIELAKPLTPKEAADDRLTAYAKSGRPAHWDEALPFLRQAIAEADEADPRSIDSAAKAADVIGEVRLSAGAPALNELAQRPPTKKLAVAQVAAIWALGRLEGDGARAAAALVSIVDRDPPPHPRGATDADRPQRIQRFELALRVTGAAINALGELRAEAAIGSLVLVMYKLPELNQQTWRALVAIGPRAADELRKVLRGQHAAVNQLFRARKLDRYCGPRGEAKCEPVSAMDFYAAHALGGFYDASAVPDLLAALSRPAAPAYFVDDAEGAQLEGGAGPKQHAAILDALRKIGSPDAAAPLRVLWADRKAAVELRAQAIATYPFVASDGAAADELGRIAADNLAADELRQETATAYARLARDPRSIALLQGLARKYLDASAAKRKEADRAKPRADTADKELEPRRQALDAMKVDLLKLTKDPDASADQIRAATARVEQAQVDFRAARLAHREKVRPFQELDRFAKGYLGFARMFQVHIARVEIAIRCKEDLACYAASLRLTTDEAAKNVLPYIKDVFDWTPEDQRRLIEAAVDRAMLELGKRGAKAQGLTGALLDQVATDNRTIRLAILLALPRIAKAPCAECVNKLAAAITADHGKPAFADLTLPTTLLRTYFARGGTK